MVSFTGKVSVDFVHASTCIVAMFYTVLIGIKRATCCRYIHGDKRIWL